MQERLIIGAMSGTSADGVDAALVRIHGDGLHTRATLLAEGAVSFPDSLRKRVLAVRAAGATSLREITEITREITLSYAATVRQVLATAQTTPGSVSAIAAHGQTLFHDPPLTMQVFDPALLAFECGIDVISDFRRADCAAGGQGAPLVPWADARLFGDASEDRVIVNIGGISNVTLLPAGGRDEGVSGFDVGPGNCISDWLLRDAGGIDLRGRRALAGKADAAAVERFMADEYVRRPPPKSTDGPAMIAVFEAAVRDGGRSLNDCLATAAAIVAECILRQTPAGTELVIAGGGVHNDAIMAGLSRQRRVRTADALGVPARSREAMAFALLGAATLDRVPANLPRVTGAARPVVLGALWPKP